MVQPEIVLKVALLPSLEPMPLDCQPTTLSNALSEQVKTWAPPEEVVGSSEVGIMIKLCMSIARP